MVSVYVSVGSNVDRERNIDSALTEIRRCFAELSTSAIYESEAFGFEGAPFYNLVVQFYADDFESTRQQLKEIEDQHLRDRSQPKYSDRTLDLDILLFGDADMHQQNIDVPRNEITRFPFILRPLAELAPQLTHPTIGKTYQQLWLDWLAEHNQPALNLVTLDS